MKHLVVYEELIFYFYAHTMCSLLYSVCGCCFYLLSYFQFTIGVNFKGTIGVALGGTSLLEWGMGPTFWSHHMQNFVFNTVNFIGLHLGPNTNYYNESISQIQYLEFSISKRKQNGVLRRWKVLSREPPRIVSLNALKIWLCQICRHCWTVIGILW